MVLDELIHHVSKFWYRLHWVVWVLINLAFLGLYILAQKLPSAGLEAKYGINDAVLYMSIGMLVYLTTIYWLVAKASRALATFIGSLLIVLQFMNVFNETNQSVSSLVYVIAWLAISWLVGMHGIVILLGAMLVTFIYLMLEIEFDFANLEPISLFLMAGSVAVVIAGYFFWRNRYVAGSSEMLNQLSGMLRTNKQQSEILMQSIADGIVVVDTKGKITLINPGASKLTGWPAKEAIGFDAKAILKLIKDDKANQTLTDSEHPLTQALTRHEYISNTLQLLSRNNKKFFVSIAISPVILPRTKEFAGAVAVFRDVSKDKEQEQQRAEFISTASHEMRTPVAAIEGYLALALNDKVSKIDEKAREYLNKAHASTQHLGKLFQDLLTSAKAEDGRLTSHPKVVEMGQFITQLAEDLKFTAEKKGLHMELIINSNTDSSGVIDTSSKLKAIQPLYFCLIDPDRIQEVITNVFDNAVKYTDGGSVTIKLTGNEQVVQVHISDTGAGIPEEDLPHLFQKFYRVDNSATRSIGGTGLGLFICKKIVELYNGNIWAESKVGEGSTFYINLPRLSTMKAEQLKTQSESSLAKA